jgi:hypothetical protein
MDRRDGRPTSAGDAVGQGMELVGQVTATAAELIRTRRDPAQVAERRRLAARRRLRAWTAGSVASGALTATAVYTSVNDGLSGWAVFVLVVLIAILAWCITGVVRAAIDLRARSRVVRSLPPPQPARPAVAGAIRGEMRRLDGYSDGLRQLAGMIGVVEDADVRALRDEILRTADGVEVRLRADAASLTAVLRARRSARADTAPELDATAEHLRREIVAGVDGYGELVSAASDAASASRALSAGSAVAGSGAGAAGTAAGSSVAGGDLRSSADRLRALAAGMRELTEG